MHVYRRQWMVLPNQMCVVLQVHLPRYGNHLLNRYSQILCAVLTTFNLALFMGTF